MLKWVYKHAVISVLQRVTTAQGTAHQYSSTSVCSQPLRKRVPNIVRYISSLFEFPASSFFLRSPSSYLRLRCGITRHFLQ